MTKPANLEYAFPLTYSSNPTAQVAAYRVIGTPFTGNSSEFDVALSPSADYALTAGDGDGSVGQYVVFSNAAGAGFSDAAYWGFDPFDPANHTPTTVRYWELQPGSDTPGDRIAPWTNVGPYTTGSAYDMWVCLVDIASTAPTTSGNWFVAEPSRAWTGDAVNASYEYYGGTPGRYLAVWDDGTGAGPTSLPAGWVPVEGPKYIGAEAGYAYFAGPALFDGTFSCEFDVDGNGWSVCPAGTPATMAEIDNTSQTLTPVPAGGHLAVYYGITTGAVPWPAGVTSLTSVTGPVAITDENVAGVIGDIAYVVSGYVYNQGSVLAELLGIPYVLIPSGGSAVLEAGSYMILESNPNQLFRVDEAGTFDANSSTGFTNASFIPGVPSPSCWPYLERYNLATKTWLPRIKLPDVPNPLGELNYAYTPSYPLNAGSNLSVAGPFIMEAGVLSGPPQPLESRFHALVNASLHAFPTTNSFQVAVGANYGDATSFPAGVYYVVASAFIDVQADDAQAIGDALGTRAVAFTFPSNPYAAEGGIAGVIGGKLYFGGGDGSNITGKEFFSYDPATGLFERLADCAFPANTWTMDYCPWGVLDGRLWAFFQGLAGGSDGLSDGLVYDPANNEWTAFQAQVSTDSYCNDQVQGVEIGGKLYFVYDRVYVFDPVALTVEAKAIPPASARGGACVVAAAGKVRFYQGGVPSAMEYDPATDQWSVLSDVVNGTSDNGYAASAVYRGAPYEFSGFGDNAGSYDAGSYVAGVYGLTGNAPAAITSGIPVLGGTLTALGGTLTLVGG